jgi:UDP-glucose 4-epimerase
MRILVTGITGRIGANLAAALVARGHAVRGLVWGRDARTEKLRPLGVELIEGNLTEAADVARATDGMDVIYHLGGAFQGGGPFSTEDYFQINVRGTYLMLEAARGLPRLQQFLFASTDALYDKYPPGGMTAPIDPDTALRFALTVGAGEILHFPQFRLSRLKETYLDLEPHWQGEEQLVIMRDHDGRPWRKHIADVRDIVAGCVAALGVPEALGQTFQLAGPAPFGWDEAIPYLAERLDLPYIDARSNGVPTYYEFDLSKGRELLGFTPQYDIRRMIDDALAFERGEDTGVLPTG